jgi:hypothetical protein
MFQTIERLSQRTGPIQHQATAARSDTHIQQPSYTRGGLDGERNENESGGRRKILRRGEPLWEMTSATAHIKLRPQSLGDPYLRNPVDAL